MKRFVLIFISTMLITITLPFGSGFNYIVADEYYPIACNIDDFEVSYIENDGSLTKVSCHSNFVEAKNEMKKNNDYVVRHNNSYSPSKIIAMNSGLAYTYPSRSGNITMYLYQNIEKKDNRAEKYKYTYLTDYYEMTYYDTLTEYGSSIEEYGKGYIKISMNGFDGYCELEYTDLIPSKYLDNSISIYVGGDHGGVSSYNHESPYSIKMKRSYYSIDKNGNYYDLVFHYYRDYIDGSSCYDNEIHVDNAENYLNAGMLPGTKYYSNDGINFYSDTQRKKFVAQVYGYYQFLSVRSKTNISASKLNSFLKSLNKSGSVLEDEGISFINAQNKYGSNALLIYAMACQESGYGTSYYSSDRNNIFGWRAYDSNPNMASDYESIEQCINQHMGRNLNWYMDVTNWRYAGTCLGNQGTGLNMLYASDPYWGIKIASIAYRIDRFANGNNGNLSDYNNYTIGVIDSNYNPEFGIDTSNWNTPIYWNSNNNSIIHYSKFNDNYQKDLTIAIIDKSNNRYKFNLANPIIDGEMYVDSGIAEYDWNKSVGYVNADRVTLTNGNVEQEEIKGPSTLKPYYSIDKLELSDSVLTIEGLGVIQGLDFEYENSSIHEIVFYDLNDSSEVLSIVAKNINSNGYSMNDGYNYEFAGFKADIDLSKLDIGNYLIKLRTTNSSKVVEESLKTSNSKNRSKIDMYDDLTYKLCANPLSNYRLELDIIDSPLDYLSINKTSVRSSIAAFDNIEIDSNGDLTINGEGFIYYLDYDNVDNIDYDVYLIDSSDNYLKLNTSLRDDDTDYKKALNSSYNLDHISFIATTKDLEMNLFDLDVGNYQIILKQSNIVDGTKYIDIVEFNNRGNSKFNSQMKDSKTVSVITSNVRKRLEININE